MARKQYARVLYFIAGLMPTPEQLEDAGRYGPGVLFRNAKHTPEDGPLEECDLAVGPAVPRRYSEAFGQRATRETREVHKNDIERGLTKPGGTVDGWGTGRS